MWYLVLSFINIFGVISTVSYDLMSHPRYFMFIIRCKTSQGNVHINNANEL